MCPALAIVYVDGLSFNEFSFKWTHSPNKLSSCRCQRGLATQGVIPAAVGRMDKVKL